MALSTAAATSGKARGSCAASISMQKLLEQVWLDQPFTAILVAHDVAEAVTLADHILVIEHGAIAIDVALSRLREHGAAELDQPPDSALTSS